MMTQKLILDVESNKPLSHYGPSHIIVYNDGDKKYHVTTREEFLREQNKKIEDLYNAFKEFKDLINHKVEENDDKYNNFLSMYKKTNEKMIGLIKSVTKMEEL